MYVRETKVENHLVKRSAELEDSICEKHVSPGRRGVPDRILTWRGLVFFIELKSPNGKLAIAQLRDHQLRERAGIKVLCLYTAEAVDRFIDSLMLLC